ncbi:MAG: beta-ketoacyl-[acyl-carrier-protein] synthase family protein [Corynebacteriales bacterium]|nr:beta-ketoacyl-[acyl-carrier-protein] synthase family protein [Mycobacteriales bacterium]
MTQVVVTGLGATTPLGGDVPTTWQRLLAGESGITALTTEWAGDMPSRIVGSVAAEPTTVIEPVKARRMDRCAQMAVVAAREAWNDAGKPEVDPIRLGVVIGTGIGGPLTLLGQNDVRREKGPRRVSPLTVPMLMPNSPAANVGLEVGAQGCVRTTVSACASGAEAIGLALDLLRGGQLDIVVAGGAEACVHPLPLAAFAQMRALSTRNDEPELASRPFDTARDGFVFSEGGGVMVLERAEFAQARGAKVYATLAGAGVTNDGFDMVQPHPEGVGAARAITQALRSGNLSKEDIVHVNAHATSTPVGDVAEAKAITSAIGTHAVLTAPKASLGHMLGAAGAVEAICTVLAIHESIVPPTRNLDNLDEEVQLDIATKAREMPIAAAVNDSFGFGGANAALAFTKA